MKLISFCFAAALLLLPVNSQAAEKALKVGIIGLDTSHVLHFTKMLNAEKSDEEFSGCRIVAAYPKGSPDIESSTKRVPDYTEKVKAMGVEIVQSIPELIEKVDAVLLETNDGRPHLEQVMPVLKANKPVFIDKPVAGSLADAIKIYEAAKKYNTPIFSASSLRFMDGIKPVLDGEIGDVRGCDAMSPCSLEPTHPDLFWYGIHGVETLCAVMGTGCETVVRVSTPTTDFVVGTWKDGRIGTFRGQRKNATTGTGAYGGFVHGTKKRHDLGNYSGYKPLLVEIVKFFKTGKPPVTAEETLEIYAFMEAADESKRRGGIPISLKEVMDKAK